MVVSRREEMGEAGFKHYLQTHWRQRQFQAMRAGAEMERKLTEERENAASWSILRASLPAGLTPEPLTVLLPSGPARARRLPARRLARYRAHLLEVISAASATDSTATPVLAELRGASGAPGATSAACASTMPGQLCALCRGGCCTKGGDQAYLSSATMRRFMDANPACSPTEVADAYLARVPVSTQAGSCINHTREGCSLPREMRSDICNRFSCPSLARVQAAQRAGMVQAVLIVRRKQDHWNRAEPELDNAITARAVLLESGLRRIGRIFAAQAEVDAPTI